MHQQPDPPRIQIAKASQLPRERARPRTGPATHYIKKRPPVSCSRIPQIIRVDHPEPDIPTIRVIPRWPDPLIPHITPPSSLDGHPKAEDVSESDLRNIVADVLVVLEDRVEIVGLSRWGRGIRLAHHTLSEDCN